MKQSIYSAKVDGRYVRGKPLRSTVSTVSEELPLYALPCDNKNMTSSSAFDDFVIVTAANAAYFAAAMDAIALVQRHLADHRIIFYDLEPAASKTHRKRIAEKIRGLCNVQYIQFNYSRYPRHVSRLNFYAWKPLIIQEALQSHESLLWIDASIRFVSGNVEEARKRARSNGGIVLFGITGHSIFSATHQRLYEYFPIEIPTVMKVQMWEANAVLIYRTQQIYSSILRWWVMCALVRDCIAPTDSLFCKFAGGSARDSTYANCHRFDQSVLNVLLVNHFSALQSTWTDPSKLYTAAKSPLKVERGSALQHSLQVCSSASRLDRDSQSKYVVSVLDYFKAR